MTIKEFLLKLAEKICCRHEWELFQEVDVDNTKPGYDGSRYSVWHLYCKKCGKFKKIKSN